MILKKILINYKEKYEFDFSKQTKSYPFSKENGLDFFIDLFLNKNKAVEDDWMFSIEVSKEENEFVVFSNIDNVNKFSEQINDLLMKYSEGQSIIINRTSSGIYYIQDNEEKIEDINLIDLSEYSNFIFENFVEKISQNYSISELGGFDLIHFINREIVIVNDKFDEDETDRKINQIIFENLFVDKHVSYIKKISHPFFSKEKVRKIFIDNKSIFDIEALSNTENDLIKGNISFQESNEKLNIHNIKSNSIYLGKYTTDIDEKKLEDINVLINADYEIDKDINSIKILFNYILSNTSNYKFEIILEKIRLLEEIEIRDAKIKELLDSNKLLELQLSELKDEWIKRDEALKALTSETKLTNFIKK